MSDEPSAGLRVLVCGGRDYRDFDAVCEALDAVAAKRGIAQVIHGAAAGADTLAALWAKTRKVEAIAFPADWKAHGRSAGAIRNRRMLAEGRPDAVVAFPGGRGTADMKAVATEAGLKVWEPVKA
jgi:hypothetical protein